MKVLITGSREASPQMLAKAVEVVVWCQQHGYTVLVGDAPGVDRAVRQPASIIRSRAWCMGPMTASESPARGAR